MPGKKKQTTPESSRKRKAETKAEERTIAELAADTDECCTVNGMFKTIKKKGQTFLDPASFPSYIQDDIWAILQECGFEYNNGFRNQDIGVKGLDHEDSMRKYLVVHGLPNMDDLEDEEDIVNLKKWVAFANVPLQQRAAKTILKTVPLPSDHQALTWLVTLGFQLDEQANTIFRLRPQLESGKEEFKSVNAIRTFVRVSPDEILLATTSDKADVFSPRKRSRRASRKNDDSALKEEDILALRLWGALTPTPLPVFGANDSDDEGEEVHPNQSSSGSQCIIL